LEEIAVFGEKGDSGDGHNKSDHRTNNSAGKDGGGDGDDGEEDGGDEGGGIVRCAVADLGFDF